MRKSRAAYLFIAPFVLFFVAFYLVPVFYAVYLSLFTRKRVGVGQPPQEVFSWFDNYARAFQDGEFLRSLLNVLLFGVIQVPIMIGLALLLALALDTYKGPLLRFFRTAFYLPYTLPTIIAGLLWGYLYSREISPFNQMLGTKIDFFDPTGLFFSIGNIVTWTWTGYNMVTLYASLQNVSQELYEAARIDGATPGQIARFIKVPLLRPTLVLTLIFSVIGTSQIFSEPFILKSSGNYIPDNITPNTYLYLAFSRDGNFYYAATLALILGFITFAFSGAFLRTAFGGERR